MKTSIFMISLAVLACLFAAYAIAQETAPATTAPAVAAVNKDKKIPDLCKDAVDPYNPGAERMRFFRAAGPAGELDEQKFEANRTADDPFVRKFDTWKEIIKFDKDGNGTIDWFEADAYRQDVRRRVLEAFDTNKTGKLTGAERDAANAALAAGKLTPLTEAAATTQPAWASNPDIIKKYGKPGAESLTPEEIAAAQKDMREKRDRQQAPWKKLMGDWMIRNFDEDGDGVLNDAEKARADEFRKELQKVGEHMQKKIFGLSDDDPPPSREQQQAKAKEMMLVGLGLMAKINKQMDIDGDGQVSDEEREAFNKRAADSVRDYIDRFTARYDKDGKGHLNADERAAMIEGIRKDMDDRIKAVHEGDGQLSANEVGRLAETFLRDIGVLRISPPKAQTEPAE